MPTISVVEGPCVGGGFGIAFACDIILAADDARFGSPFRNIGILPDSAIQALETNTAGGRRFG